MLPWLAGVVASWPRRAELTQMLEPAGMSAGTASVLDAEPSLPTPLSSDDRAELKTPSTEVQTRMRSVSLNSALVHEASRLMLEPAGTDEPAAGVPVR